MGKSVKGVLIGLAIFGGFLGYRFYNKSAAGKEARAAIQSWVADAPGYKENQEYFDSLVDSAHEAAFSASYSMGGRRRGSSFDVKEYGASVFSHMKAKAEMDGRPEVASSIQTVWKEFDKAQAAEPASTPKG